MPFICAFDQTTHEDLDSLHAHLKRYRVSRAKYYTTYHPRYDKLTGELIVFKDYDQYMKAEFTSKVTLRKWLSQNREAGLVWATEWLRGRKVEKGLVYAPSQAELRTLAGPSMPYYDTVAAAQGGYYGVARGLDYRDRYTAAPLRFTPLVRGAKLIQDTREQRPLTLSKVTVIEEALDVGDYALAAPHDQGIRIERKSLADFCGTLNGRMVTTTGKKGGCRTDSALARFAREMDRAVEANLYVVMMVESTIADAQSFNYLPHMKHVKVSSAYVMKNMRDLLTKYPLHLQILFVDGKTEMAAKLIRVLELGLQVRTTDLQDCYERNLL